MGDIASDLRKVWNDTTLPMLVRSLASDAGTALSVARKRIAELEEHASWQADEHADRSRREDELRHLLADLLDRIHPTWEQALPATDPTRAAAKHARRRPEEVGHG